MKTLLLFGALALALNSFGQQQFLKTYGTSMDEFIGLNLNHNLKKLDNGNYVLIGGIQDNKRKPFIIYLNSLFDTLSTTYYEINGSLNDYISGFELYGDDSIMVAGTKLTALNNFDFYIGKTNIGGDLDVVKTTTSINHQGWPKLLDLGDSTYIVTSHTTISSNNIESQVLRIDNNLNILWSNLYAYKGNEGVLDLCKDSDTTITVVSVSRVGTDLTDNDIIVSKIHVDGTTIWVKNLNGGYQDHINKIISLNNGTLMTGYSINSFGDKDIIVAKFDNNGDTLFVKTYGGNADDEGVDIIEETNGDFVVVGRTYSFGNGASDGFMMRLNSAGDIISSKSFGTNTDDYFSAILKYNSGFVLAGLSNGLSASADIFLLGVDSLFTDYFCPFQDTINMVEKSLNFSLSNQAFSTPNSMSYGLGNAIINNHTLNINNINTNSDNVIETVTECDSYTWATTSQNYTQTGQYTTVLTNLQGCDSTITLDLTITNSNTGTDTQTACDTYTWIDGNTYTSDNNTATWTETNAAGCDSLVTLDLTVTYSNTGTDVQTACDSYIWLDGNTYTSNNNSATWTETNAAGCDSLVTLDLTITPLPDNNVTQSGSQLTADQVGATYQWLDCDNSYAVISGETNQSYTPTNVTGNYAVEVTLNGCVDTSACYHVDYTGIEQLNHQPIFLTPNPTSDFITIEGIENVTGIKGMELVSSAGRVVEELKVGTVKIDVSMLSSGTYFLSITHANGTERLRFVKE